LIGHAKYIKSNNTPFRDSLIKEAQGLNLLRRYTVGENLRVVEVFDVDEQCLTMTRVDPVPATKEHWTRLARGLASLHEQRMPGYGLDGDNYIGLSPQSNGISSDWGRFFIEKRLRVQVDNIASPALRKQFSAVLTGADHRLAEFLRETCQHPSLLHGDLWSGNVLFGRYDDVWLIDPAIYYGDAEADLAMTEMFGGFSSDFYSIYCRLRPLSSAYLRKKVIYNLYHYLNHLNLFGQGYLADCEQGMSVIEAL